MMGIFNMEEIRANGDYIRQAGPGLSLCLDVLPLLDSSPLCRMEPVQKQSSFDSLPIEAVPARLKRVELNGHFRTDWLVCLVNNHDVPGSLCLEYGNVVLTTPFAADNRVAMPVVVADKSNAGQRNPTGINHPPDNITRRSGTAGAWL